MLWFKQERIATYRWQNDYSDTLLADNLLRNGVPVVSEPGNCIDAILNLLRASALGKSDPLALARSGPEQEQHWER
jgi:hypothetical protein